MNAPDKQARMRQLLDGDSARWPMRPRLPLVRYREDDFPEIGFVHEAARGHVFLGDVTTPDESTLPQETFASVDAMLEAGWEVD